MPTYLEFNSVPFKDTIGLKLCEFTLFNRSAEAHYLFCLTVNFLYF